MQHVLLIAVLAAAAWLGVRALDLVERFALGRLRIDMEDNRRMRRLRT